ncbi:MAG: ABC transporter ATP-binding protein, partial [Tepidisphaeraceae bacterium]
YEEMSGRAFVRTLARLHGYRGRAGDERTDEVLRQVGMSARADRPLGSYSKGMRQRIKLAQAMVHDPELLVLDEPLNGVDPVGRSELAALFSRLGKAILISSHVLEDMDRLADRVLFICRGRILACGSLAEIRRMLDGHPLRVCIAADRPRPLAARLLESEFVQAVELEEGGKLVVQARSPKSFFELLTTLVVDEGFEIRRLEVTDASTQAVFDYLMGPTIS